MQPLDQLHLPDQLDEDVRASMDHALALRPELGQREADKRAAEATLRQAHSAFLPSLSFQGYGGETRAYGQQDQLPSTYAGQLQIWDTSLELRWQVFDGARRFAELSRAHAERQRSEAALHDTRDQVEMQVWNAYIHLRTAFQERDAAAVLVQSAQLSYEASLKSYQYGLRNTVDVVTAQRQLADALRTDVAARTDLLTQLATFRYRTGDLLNAPTRGVHP